MDTPAADKDPVLWSARPDWAHFVFLWIFVFIMAVRGIIILRMGYLTAAAFHLAALVLLSGIAVFLRQTSQYTLTRSAVHRSEGLLGKGRRTFPLKQIESVDEQRGPLDRLLGTGDLVLELQGGTRQRLSGIKHPEVIARKIRALL